MLRYVLTSLSVMLSTTGFSQVICSYEDGGYKFFSTKSGYQIGESSFDDRDVCDGAAERSTNGVLCALDGDGDFGLYATQNAARIGNSVFDDRESCENVYRSSPKGIMCAYTEDDDKFAFYSTHNAMRIGQSVFDSRQSCVDRTLNTRKGVACAYSDDRFRLFSVRSSNQIGISGFGEREQCEAVFSGIRNGLVCSISSGDSFAVFVANTGKRLGSRTYSRRETCERSGIGSTPPTNPIGTSIVAKYGTFLKHSTADSSTLDDNQKCWITAGTSLRVIDAKPIGRHFQITLARPLPACRYLGTRVFAFEDHIEFR